MNFYRSINTNTLRTAVKQFQGKTKLKQFLMTSPSLQRTKNENSRLNRLTAPKRTQNINNPRKVNKGELKLTP